ncbi:NAD(P)-dependent oxidoreductase, partial [Salmonella enterica subsp. enterica serovar Virginia]|nr:NAD(P)-dependent oxidoreductase [Salmonella enterica subsp. enterica serovar Virginia]
NAPGSRHPKRWQDIEELLEAGIDVFTTVNVQHLESLNDVVSGGPAFDENALIAALQNGEIYAAGLDVFEHEPLSVDSPLLNMSNVVAV